ncbi:MAG: ribosome recycling factor [Chloroflexota bacterium]
MEKSLDALRRELDTIRTGRANPAIIEHLQVDYYGSPTPLQQLATISSPDARQLLVQPYDRTAIGAIEKAIRGSDLGFNPTNEGTLIRIAIPALTEERRRDLVKLVHRRVEEAKVAVRNVRREELDRLKKQLKEKEISQDEEKRAQDDLQKVTDQTIQEADKIGEAKEREVLEV